MLGSKTLPEDKLGVRRLTSCGSISGPGTLFWHPAVFHLIHPLLLKWQQYAPTPATCIVKELADLEYQSH